MVLDGRGAPLVEGYEVLGRDVSHEVRYAYGPEGRLTSMRAVDGSGAWDDVFTELDYEGARLGGMRSGRDGFFGRSDLFQQTYGYTGWALTNTNVGFDANGGGVYADWMSRNTTLDELGRPISYTHVGPGGVAKAEHQQWYGRDDKVVWSTIRIRHNSYSVPSRLIGELLKVRVFEERIDIYYAQKLEMSVPRLLGRMGHNVDYRHVIASLLRKPRAFKNDHYQDSLFPIRGLACCRGSVFSR